MTVSRVPPNVGEYVPQQNRHFAGPGARQRDVLFIHLAEAGGTRQTGDAGQRIVSQQQHRQQQMANGVFLKASLSPESPRYQSARSRFAVRRYIDRYRPVASPASTAPGVEQRQHQQPEPEMGTELPIKVKVRTARSHGEPA